MWILFQRTQLLSVGLDFGLNVGEDGSNRKCGCTSVNAGNFGVCDWFDFTQRNSSSGKRKVGGKGN